MKSLYLFILLTISATLYGCAGTGTTLEVANAGILAKQTMVIAATSTSSSCILGLIPVEECNIAGASYEAGKLASLASLQLLLANAIDPGVRTALQNAINDGFPILDFSSPGSIK